MNVAKRLRLLIVLLLAIQLSNCAFAQTKADVLQDTSLISNEQYQYLVQNFSKNKVIPAGYEKIILYALSFFPELKEYKIKFQVRPKGSPLSSRPAWGSVFSNARKRTYMVFIHAHQDSSVSSDIFNRAPIPGQIGIVGHELSHVVNFTKESSFGLIGIGASHISKSYMDRFEFYTDSLCIEHGLGYYLMYWTKMFEGFYGDGDSVQAYYKSKSTPTGERYMSAKTIQKYIDKSPMYRKPETDKSN